MASSSVTYTVFVKFIFQSSLAPVCVRGQVNDINHISLLTITIYCISINDINTVLIFLIKYLQIL